MKIIPTAWILILMASRASAGVVTLMAGESYQLSSNDVAEVLSLLPGGIPVSASGSVATLMVDGKPLFTTLRDTYGNGTVALAALTQPQLAVIAGPRNISSVSNAVTSFSLVTLRITDKLTFEQSRNSSAPALTAVIPNNPGNFNVLLEASSDLVTWNPALPGSYGGGGSNRFFRVRVQQAP